MPRRPPVHRGVRAEGCAGAGRPLCRDKPKPLAIPLPSEAPIAGAYVLKADQVTSTARRAEATGSGARDIRAVSREQLRAEARPRACDTAVPLTRLAVYLKALACNFKRMVHARLVEMENRLSGRSE